MKSSQFITEIERLSPYDYEGGNTIEPSGHQLPPGKKMWKAWKKRGDAEHLMKEEVIDEYETIVDKYLLN